MRHFSGVCLVVCVLALVGVACGDPGLSIQARDSYLPGIPILVRVEILEDGCVRRDVWDATVGIASEGNENIVLSTHELVMFNGLASGLVTVNGGGDFTLVVNVAGMEAHHDLVDLSGVEPITCSGTLEGTSTTWSGIVHVTSDLLVPADHVLTIEPGTLVLISGTDVPLSEDGVDINVRGRIRSQGHPDSIVTFTADDPAVFWGEIHHDSSSPSQYEYTHVTRGGHSPRSHHTNTGPVIRPVNSQVEFDHVCITDLAGKIMLASNSDLTFGSSLFARAVMGPEIYGTAWLFEDGYITEMLGIYQENGQPPDDNDGIKFGAQASGDEIVMRRSVIALGNDDGIDTDGSIVQVDDTIIRDFATDKGISVDGGHTYVRNSLIVGNNIGVETKNRSAVLTVINSTLVDNVNGVRFRNTGTGTLTRSIVRGSADSVYGATEDVQIDYCNVGEEWPGEGNILDDPLFADPDYGDYHLKSQAGRWLTDEGRWTIDEVTSPCIDAGDPNSDWTAELWPHGKRINMGMYGGTGQASMSLSQLGSAMDLDGDGVTTWSDIALLVQEWLSDRVPQTADVNRDDVVDMKDLALMGLVWEE